MKRKVLCFSTMLIVLSLTLPAGASLIGTDWSNSNSGLYKFDPATATATLIGLTGQIRMIGLVVDTDSTIYAISEEPNSRLWTLDPNNGSSTFIGFTGFNLQEGDMTIDPLTGDIYVADAKFGSDNLYRIDPTNAATTLVGNFGADGRDISGLQFFGNTLYGLALRDASPDALVTVNKLTGLATFVGDTGTNFGIIAGMGRDPVSNTVFIAGPTTNFGSDNTIWSLDLGTGAATFVAPLTGFRASVSGFSVAGDPPILLPEPGTFVLLGVGTLALLSRRRSRLS